MSQRDFLKQITTSLLQNGIPFMIAGSVGSARYGEPRSTNDVDIVIDPTAEQLDALLGSFPETYYVSRDAATEALSRRSMFNVIDTTTGWKADLIVLKDRPFSREEFARRTSVTLMGLSVDLASPEDIVLSKLEWAQQSGSDRQIRDARSVLLTLADQIDLDYLQKWSAELGVGDLLKDLLSSE